MARSTRCDSCGEIYTVGQWYLCPHGAPSFRVDNHQPKFDIGLGEMVTSNNDRSRIARSKNLIEKHPPADTYARRQDVRDRQMSKKEMR